MQKQLAWFFLIGSSLVWGQEALQIGGKKITQIEIMGLNDEAQKKNAELFLQLNKVKNLEINRVNEDNENKQSLDYIQYLIEQGKKEIAQSQQPFGYYNTQVNVQLKETQKGELTAIYQVNLGQAVQLQKVNIHLTGEALQDEGFQKLLAENPLKQGGNLNHQEYELYKAKFSALANARGFFDGQFLENQVIVNPENQTAVVNLAFDSGVRYRYGNVQYGSRDGTEIPLDADLLQRFVQFKPNEPYLSADVSTLQQNLQGSNYFSEVLVGGQPNRETKTVPIDAQITMNANKHYVYGIGYSTDSGIRGKFEFNRRWVNRRGHQLETKLFASQKESKFDALYKMPANNPTTDFHYFRLGGELKYTDYKTKRIFAEGGYNYKVGHWNHRYSLTASYDNFRIGTDKNKTKLLYPKAQWTYTSTNDILAPLNGYQARFEVMGGAKALLSDVNFAQTNLDLRYLKALNEKHRIVARFTAGGTWTSDFHRLPPSLRYFAGGDKSVRGYSYEKLGARDVNGTNIGGKYRAVGSLEYEYYFTDSLAGAVFVDAGDAWINDPKMKTGAGVGVHWRSPVGPIKLDVGHGFNKKYGDPFRIHLSIGTELDL